MKSSKKTELADRTLFWNGQSLIAPESIMRFLAAGVPINQIIVTNVTPPIEKFNKINPSEFFISTEVPAEIDLLTKKWNVPEEFLSIDVEEYLVDRLIERSLGDKYEERLAFELDELKKRKLVNLIRALIYVVSVFKENGVVWGVGRGSSCASLILFLIGLNLVDPVKFDIPAEEFYHD